MIFEEEQHYISKLEQDLFNLFIELVEKIGRYSAVNSVAGLFDILVVGHEPYSSVQSKKIVELEKQLKEHDDLLKVMIKISSK